MKGAYLVAPMVETLVADLVGQSAVEMVVLMAATKVGVLVLMWVVLSAGLMARKLAARTVVW